MSGLQPPPFVELSLTSDACAQIETQLCAAFGLTPEAAHTWVETTRQQGVCFGRVQDGRIAASFAGEAVELRRGDERLRGVMLQSCYVHPEFRGRGYGLERFDVETLRRRFDADHAVLTLFEDGLIPYWRRRGFEVVQPAEVVGWDEFTSRMARRFSPVLSPRAIAAKIAEVEADGALIETETDAVSAGERVFFVRYPGDQVVDEAVVTSSRPTTTLPVEIRLKTVMASPPGLDLVCAIDL